MMFVTEGWVVSLITDLVCISGYTKDVDLTVAFLAL